MSKINPNKTYAIQNLNSGKMVEPRNGKAELGAPLVQHSGFNDQFVFRMIPVDKSEASNRYYIEHVATGFLATAIGGAYSEVVLTKKADSEEGLEAQTWVFFDAPGNYFVIKSLSASLDWCIYHDKPNNGSKVLLAYNESSRVWNLIPV
jgi:hypothetical protein